MTGGLLTEEEMFARMRSAGMTDDDMESFVAWFYERPEYIKLMARTYPVGTFIEYNAETVVVIGYMRKDYEDYLRVEKREVIYKVNGDLEKLVDKIYVPVSALRMAQ